MPPPTVFIEVRLVEHPVAAAPLDPFPQPAGAECVFIGRTRDETHPEHGPLRRLSYDAYRPMALDVLRGIADRAVAEHGCLAIRIHHALGDVAPGEASVLVQVVTGHRDAAFAACRFLIDRLKAEAPIWKRQEWADGHAWSEGTTVAEPAP